MVKLVVLKRGDLLNTTNFECDHSLVFLSFWGFVFLFLDLNSWMSHCCSSGTGFVGQILLLGQLLPPGQHVPLSLSELVTRHQAEFASLKTDSVQGPNTDVQVQEVGAAPPETASACTCCPFLVGISAN